ncbi:MAG: LamG-like jellyroll fold domain-containing protein [Phycisphaeraceae bacterium]|nr:LamG-like jellyroll fold domain-containing protein [Phycisphaeraceae bacterium]
MPATVLGGLKQFTLSFWMRSDESHDASSHWRRPTLIGQGFRSASTGDFGITTRAGRLGYWTGLAAGETDRRFESTRKVNDHRWHLVTLRCDDRHTQLFLDGRLLPDSERAAGLPVHLRPVHLGGLSGHLSQTSHRGAIDDLGVWNKPLTEAQIFTLYQLARHRQFQYDLGQVQRLFDLHETGMGTPRLGGYTWQRTEKIDTEVGVLSPEGRQFHLKLDDSRWGLIATPVAP